MIIEQDSISAFYIILRFSQPWHIDMWGQIILCCGACSITGYLAASVDSTYSIPIFPHQVLTPRMSPDIANVSWGRQNHPQMRPTDVYMFCIAFDALQMHLIFTITVWVGWVDSLHSIDRENMIL